ncbi:AP endonuclease [Clostridium botulinum]|nr:AP endonuclease [Clostridium botulinum]NFA17700.1 AP endonuclease [Clostridium botulinum]NFA54340.1 AP endonuclease [Clostridium botulinum]NFA67844.1 AP endonuclease [Clostridium botulinum]NFE17036.1 AP endonuclease [Clostridium botulinum]
MKINGVELQDLDILDLEVAEKYEEAIKGIDGIAEKVQGMTIAESVRTQCNAIFKIFNDLFGEGTDKKIFGNKVNLLTCLQAFDELITQTNTSRAEIEKIANKYSPNRAQRRNKK